MKIGVITKREKAHKAGSVMQKAAELLRSRGVEVDEIYPEDSGIDVARVEADCDLYLLKSGAETALSLAGVLHAAGAKIINPYPTVVAMRAPQGMRMDEPIVRPASRSACALGASASG